MNNKSYLNLERKYKNRQGVNIGQKLIAPCLAGEPKLYRRGTAYFSSSSMKAYAESMSKLIEKNVKFEIICSPVIQDKGLIEILESNSTKEKKEINVIKLAENIMLDAVGFEKNKENVSYRSKVLSYLIASGRLEIKFAIPKAIEKLITEISYEDLYHVKNGYFVFSNGDEVAFEGSFNESEGGHSKNIESTLVFRSWKSGDLERLEDTKQEIDGDWNEEEDSKDLKIYPLGDEILEKIKRIASKTPPIKPHPPSPTPPPDPDPDPTDDDLPYDLMPHQTDALEKWKDNNYKGILALATGSGKTITAIHAAVVASKKETLCLVISVPYIVLAEQWVEVLNEYGVVPYECFGSSKKWYSKLENVVGRFNLGIKNFLPIIVVNATLNGEKFQSQLKKIENSDHGEIFMISDECHHHANKNIIKKLPKAKYILGLSATPWNPGDEESEVILKSYYVDEVATYTLQQALDDKRLCPYSYHIHEVEMNSDEEEEYLRLTRLITSLYSKESLNPSEQSMLDNTIFKRARLLDGIEDKFNKLAEIIKLKKPSPYKLFYCGSGYQASYEDDEDLQIEKDSIRIIDRITEILDEQDWDVSKFTSTESHRDRRNVLKTFKSKQIHAIAAIKVLDEGFDVPMCDEAYFTASSSSERQWVQRRGRILRKSDNKDSAIVHDFVITKTSSTTNFKELIAREMARVDAFFESCSNQHDIELQIKAIKNAYLIDGLKEE